MQYIPKVFCEKCQQPAGVVRVQKENERWVRAFHHGETQDIPFVDKPDQTIRLWQSPAVSSN